MHGRDGGPVIRVLLADDHGVLREGLCRLLEMDPGIKVVAAANDGREAVAMAAETLPGVVVMDVSMPNLDGIEATRSIVRKTPGTGVVILSMHASAGVIRQALLAGARGYVLKGSAGDEVVRAVKAVAAGRRYMGDGVDGSVLAEYPNGPAGAGVIESLTPRERQILQLVAEGKSNAEAAQILGLSPRSVETYRGRLMHKLNIKDLPSLVKFAIRHGLTSAE
jgi:DNA-binding NarL/FixJ family response regulator